MNIVSKLHFSYSYMYMYMLLCKLFIASTSTLHTSTGHWCSIFAHQKIDFYLCEIYKVVGLQPMYGHLSNKDTVAVV